MASNPAGLEEVYDHHVVQIFRFLYARVGNRPDAEDLTAQVFMRAIEHLDTGRDPREITAWLYRVAQNAVADHWRSYYRLPVLGIDHVAPGWEPAEAVTDAGTARAHRTAARVERLLRGLPDRYRRVLELRFLQRLTVDETARVMGISHGNAKVLQYRALRRAALIDGGSDG